jgi:hypothetical protein
MIDVYSENHKKPIYTKHSVTECYDNWDIYLPLGFKGLNSGPYYWVLLPRDLAADCSRKKYVHAHKTHNKLCPYKMKTKASSLDCS